MTSTTPTTTLEERIEAAAERSAAALADEIEELYPNVLAAMRAGNTRVAPRLDGVVEDAVAMIGPSRVRSLGDLGEVHAETAWVRFYERTCAAAYRRLGLESPSS